MRGPDQKQDAIFIYVSPEDRVPSDHPLRHIRTLVDGILKDMSTQFGQKLYSDVGRPSITPKQLLRALLLQIFYSVRSEHLLMDQLDYNLLFRWFVGMNMDEPVWVATVFTKDGENFTVSGAAIRPVQDQSRRQAVPQESISEARLSYLGHTLVEQRSGLLVATYLTGADGYAERDAALLMAYQKRCRSRRPMTLCADKAHDTQDFVAALRDLKIHAAHRA